MEVGGVPVTGGVAVVPFVVAVELAAASEDSPLAGGTESVLDFLLSGGTEDPPVAPSGGEPAAELLAHLPAVGPSPATPGSVLAESKDITRPIIIGCVWWLL